MSTDRRIAGLLGAAFLVVAILPMLGGLLTAPMGGAATDELLRWVGDHPFELRAAILADLVTSLAVVALGVLLYVVFRERYRLAALLGLGWFLVEAALLALSKIGAYGLIPLSQVAGQPGTGDGPALQALADTLYRGLDRQGNDLHMLFFCAGAILWYALFVRSRLIPRVLSIWGLASVSLLTVNVVMALYQPGIGHVVVLAAAYVPFEPVLGLWLLVRGFSEGAPIRAPVGRPVPE